MALEDEKLRIKALGAAGKTAPENSRIDESVMRLARLIGRQMARDEFDRRYGKRVKGAAGIKERGKSS